MSPIREFTTAAQKATDAVNWIEFKIDDQICRAVAEPSDGQVAFLMSYNVRHVSATDKMGAMLNFFDSTLDDDTQEYVMKRLLDPADPFGMEDINNVLTGLLEDWSGRPTQSSSGSTSSPPSTGLTSIPPPPPPISSTSLSTGSATMSTPGSGITPLQTSATG